MNFQKGPIIACSTGMGGNSALGIIRLSGFASLMDLRHCFSCDLSKIRPRQVFQANIVEGKRILDNCLLTFFQAPKSYTGEHLLEMSVHGNILNIKRIIDHFRKTLGIREALPGEFSFRAFGNGKLSFSQLEGLDLFLRATSGLMLDQGIQILQGDLYKNFASMRHEYLQLKAAVELSIDFLEDVGRENAGKRLWQSFNALKKRTVELFRRSQGNREALLSPTVVLAGRPNAGKSSLFNHLLAWNRSIVSDTIGTTRDFVSENIFYQGVGYRLVDTAGLANFKEPVEREAVERARQMLERAFFKILVVNPFDRGGEDLSLVSEEEFDLVVLTHKDLDGFESALPRPDALPKFRQSISVSLKSGPIGPQEGPAPMGPQEGAAPMGAGEQILALIRDKYLKLGSGNPLLIERHCRIIEEIHEKMSDLEKTLKQQKDVAIVASEIDLLGASVEELVGEVSANQVLENVFENFCIGK